MASLLESQVKKMVAQGFKGRLLKGTIRQETSTAVDFNGDPVVGVVTTHSFEGIRQDFSAYTRAMAGIPETDVSILILLGSTKATNVRQGDKIFMSTPWNKWHEVRRILEVDPAGASMKVQAYEIPEP